MTLGSFHPGTNPGESLCTDCVAQCKPQCIDRYEMVKCRDYVKGLHPDTEEQFAAKCKAELEKIKRAEQTGPTKGNPSIEYLQQKSDQSEPVKVPQYERD
jgi:hypothetical protein